jgi:hypothetical protein
MLQPPHLVFFDVPSLGGTFFHPDMCRTLEVSDVFLRWLWVKNPGSRMVPKVIAGIAA